MAGPMAPGKTMSPSEYTKRARFWHLFGAGHLMALLIFASFRIEKLVQSHSFKVVRARRACSRVIPEVLDP